MLTMGGLHVRHAVQRGIGYQLSICSSTEENHGKPWSSWPVSGPSGYKLTSSQQSGIKYANPNISPCVSCSFISKVYICFSTVFFFCILWMSSKHLCITFVKGFNCSSIDKFKSLLWRGKGLLLIQ